MSPRPARMVAASASACRRRIATRGAYLQRRQRSCRPWAPRPGTYTSSESQSSWRTRPMLLGRRFQWLTIHRRSGASQTWPMTGAASPSVDTQRSQRMYTVTGLCGSMAVCSLRCLTTQRADGEAVGLGPRWSRFHNWLRGTARSPDHIPLRAGPGRAEERYGTSPLPRAAQPDAYRSAELAPPDHRDGDRCRAHAGPGNGDPGRVVHGGRQARDACPAGLGVLLAAASEAYTVASCSAGMGRGGAHLPSCDATGLCQWTATRSCQWVELPDWLRGRVWGSSGLADRAGEAGDEQGGKRPGQELQRPAGGGEHLACGAGGGVAVIPGAGLDQR